MAPRALMSIAAPVFDIRLNSISSTSIEAISPVSRPKNPISLVFSRSCLFICRKLFVPSRVVLPSDLIAGPNSTANLASCSIPRPTSADLDRSAINSSPRPPPVRLNADKDAPYSSIIPNAVPRPAPNPASPIEVESPDAISDNFSLPVIFENSLTALSLSEIPLFIIFRVKLPTASVFFLADDLTSFAISLLDLTIWLSVCKAIPCDAAID